MMSKSIMLVDDEDKLRNILSKVLTKEGYKVLAVGNGHQAIELYPSFIPDLMILDYKMPGMTGIELMNKIKELNPNQTFLFLTAFGNVSLAVEAIKEGAYDFIEKPFDNERFLHTINKALENNELKSKITTLKKQLFEKSAFDNIIGNSFKIQQVFSQVNKVAETNATVLLTGESGVGKELVAKAIHNTSFKKNGAFIAVNCGAIPIHLMESEFFGYEKGAFTDAKESKPGLFELANGGTLFLDEVAELTLEAQVKLLRVLEEKKVFRLGGKKTIPVDMRIISATNKNIEEKVKDGSFRLDLLYRLNLFTITIPPLRERKDDIPLLVDYFITKHNSTLNLKISNISREAIETLTNYSWPGNIRDLENALQSAMILCCEGIITNAHLPSRVKGYIQLSEQNDLSYIIPTILGKKEISPELEKEIITDALIKCKHHKSTTAKLLNISRKTLFNKMKKYNL
jgi:DNA-binding NtrC family response regulator